MSAVVYHMARLHVRDEARHVAHTRAECAEAMRLVALALRRFAVSLYYPPAALYEAAGLPPGTDWRALALRSGERRRFVARAMAPTVDFLGSVGWAV